MFGSFEHKNTTSINFNSKKVQRLIQNENPKWSLDRFVELIFEFIIAR